MQEPSRVTSKLCPAKAPETNLIEPYLISAVSDCGRIATVCERSTVAERSTPGGTCGGAGGNGLGLALAGASAGGGDGGRAPPPLPAAGPTGEREAAGAGDGGVAPPFALLRLRAINATTTAMTITATIKNRTTMTMITIVHGNEDLSFPSEIAC